MSKIFRLYKEGTATYEDWNNSPAFPYNSTSRDTIEDPDGAKASQEITSIPSPFARIDLVKAAFKEVCSPDKSTKKVNLDGKTIFHKTVSDALDVAEIFFNIDKFKGKIEIIKWDPSLMLQELTESEIPGHCYLADALRKYMLSDAGTYNFGQMKNIYLLNYINGKDELNIIGATSPATLFFSTANNLSYVKDIFFGEDRPFDGNYQPLYKRDFEFVKYLFAQRSSIPNFAGLFPEVDAYLAHTFSAITDHVKRSELRDVAATDLDSLSPISVVDAHHSDIVEVLGFPFYHKTVRSITSISDFTIKTTKDIATCPLVLPIESGNKYSDLQYTTDRWGKLNAAPPFDEEADLLKRVLPFDGTQTPYLTISDFLENTIVRVPHTLNVESYFAANLKLDKPKLAYLLPVKPLLFEYFSPEEVRGEMLDGKPMLEMESLAGKSGVKVILRIPIKGSGKISYIEYARIYYNSQGSNEKSNEGGMTEFRFTGFVMPQIRFNDENDAIYNVSCVQGKDRSYEFSFYKEAKKLSIGSSSCRDSDKQLLTKAVNYQLKNTNFDFIQVCNSGYRGVLLPLFKEQRNIEQFEFSIDLGTSNTHIEYRKDNAKPTPFVFTQADRQLCEMFVPKSDDLIEETGLIEKDFIPAEIGNSDFYFPTRTVLSHAKVIDWDKPNEPYGLANLPFTYDKRKEQQYNKYRTNLKWGKGDDGRAMELYVQCLMLIIRNKVLLNSGDLQRTKITWFYPLSMAPKRLRKLRDTWNDAYRKYFGQGGNCNCMTESSAPIQYLFKSEGTATNLVNIDIGGGTTDIAFAKDRVVSHVTSFRFASNALFENPYSDFDDHNGIVDEYKDSIKKLLNDNHIEELPAIFDSTDNEKPSNMASFLFGLKDNSKLKGKIDSKTVDFNYILQEDEDFKIVFILFYTAIIYHVAQIVKYLNLEMPRHIAFTGNGSKVIRIITTDSKLLARYTKIIFEKVLGKKYDKELDLIGLQDESNPKVSTCKGGLLGVGATDNPSSIVFKADCSGLVADTDTYSSITDDYKQRTLSAVTSFFNFALEDMNKEFNFDNNFGVRKKSMDIAREVAKKDLATFLDKGINLHREEIDTDNDKIEETFFYYPIKGVLNAISSEIFNKLHES